MLPRDVAVVMATLRQLAGWCDDDRSPAALAELATVLETEDWADCPCCPMCQEVDCDDGCPLAYVRAGYLR